MSGLRDLIREVHRRSIWWALGAYIAVGWLVFELIQQIAESAGQPWLPNVASGPPFDRAPHCRRHGTCAGASC